MLLATSVFAATSTLANTIPNKPATEYTKKINAAFINELPFGDKQDFLDATQGFIAPLPDGEIKDNNGNVVWSLNAYKFINADRAPDTVNPSLWRIAQLNMNNGLFKVVDRIYQVRGYDLSNMTIIEGNTGIILIDPLISKETAKAALELYYANRPKNPVVAVIYTHSHVDHFGGVKGVVSETDVNSGKVAIIAPDGFLEEAVSENVYAGNAMSRRSLYQYGALLPRNATGQIDAGLGKTTSLGEVTLIPPTEIITKSGQKLTVDGVDMEFQMAPNTEAPAEMLIYFPEFKALCAAEDLTHTLHNLYTLRGAQVRDANKWWQTINEAIETYGEKIEVLFAQHHWPKWGNENIIPYMENQRDQFKYLHDQSLNLMNSGYTMVDLAEIVTVPEAIAKQWYNRGYYGSVNHDSKAVYQRYLGWYDSNPANLYPLPNVLAAKKYVEYMGGANAVMKRAKKSYDAGDYRWVAEVMKHVVFADPTNEAARNLQADAFEQLGYQQENSTWRNEYLMGAYELRNGIPKSAVVTASVDVINSMPLKMLFDYIGICLNGSKASKISSAINMIFTDKTETPYKLRLKNGVLIYTANKQFVKPDVTVTWSRKELIEVLAQKTNVEDLINKGIITVTGDKNKLQQLFASLDTFDRSFPIVTPR